MTIPEEAVVAGAKAMDAYWGGRYAPDEVEELRGEVTAILGAAAPYLYPRESGDFTVIGPECFTDGTVIAYKGENYVKQAA